MITKSTLKCNVGLQFTYPEAWRQQVCSRVDILPKQCFLIFLMLQHFIKVPHVVMIPIIRLSHLPLHDSKFAIVVNCNIKIQYSTPVKGLFNPQRGFNPQVENHCPKMGEKTREVRAVKDSRRFQENTVHRINQAGLTGAQSLKLQPWSLWGSAAVHLHACCGCLVWGFVDSQQWE